MKLQPGACKDFQVCIGDAPNFEENGTASVSAPYSSKVWYLLPSHTCILCIQRDAEKGGIQYGARDNVLSRTPHDFVAGIQVNVASRMRIQRDVARRAWNLMIDVYVTWRLSLC